MPNQKIFNQLLIYMNFYQHVKNEAVLSICCGEIVDWEILQSHWLTAFWSISQKQDFSQYLGRITANNITSHYRTNSVKINDKFLFKDKKPYFWATVGPFFQFLEQKRFFPKTPDVSCTTSQGFLAPSQNSEKSNNTIPGKYPDRQQDRRTNKPVSKDP